MRALLAPLLVAAAIPAFAQAPKKPADIPVESFFKRPQFAEMVLSPDGRKLAALTPLKGRNNLVVVDLDKRTRNVITDFERVDATGIFWVNDRRLCLRVVDGQVVSGEPNFRGTYCINDDGGDLRNFSSVGGSGPRRGIQPVTPIFDGSDDILVSIRLRSRRSSDIYRFNTVTGRYQILTEDSPGDVQAWSIDRDFVPRVAVSLPEERQEGTKPRVATVWYRENAQAKWEKLWSYGALTADDVYEPVAFDFDNETLYVSTNHGRDKMAIYAYDTRSRKMGNLLLEHPLIDVAGGLVFSLQKKKLVGVRVEADKRIDVWTDPDLARIQRSIDAALPNTINSLQFAPLNNKRALVYSYSDTDPGTYSMYDDEKKSLETIVRTREWIDPALMAERRFITYKARDGMEIPAWITIPKGGGKNLPLIVNVHGGPWVRGYAGVSWGRWPEAQFFASRGYLVLEPEPRGSTGYGRKHYVASFKQWGLTMQDDINDGALYLASQGLADRSRMCIHGGSYGGYATLEGLARDPDLWKCGSAFVAVSDLGLLQEVVYSDTAIGSDYLQYDYPRLVGDSSRDKAYFDKASPARNAARFKAPLLLAMGSNDVRVPLVHGETMKGALEDAHKVVEYVVYTGEGHGFNKDEHVFDHYRRIEKFFAQALK